MADPDRCSHCIIGVKPLGDGWTHIDDDPTCVDFWQSQANALDPDAARAWWAEMTQQNGSSVTTTAKEADPSG